jgi:3-hydroxyacyl-CoA dehydrogenase
MDINKIACVGAGLIGQGWATLFSSEGFEVILQDVSEAVLQESIRGIRSTLMFLEANNLLKQGRTDTVLGKIKTCTHIRDAVCHADYVQESVPDSYEIKKQVFKEMDGAAPNHAILASSSSGLLMTEIQKATKRPPCSPGLPYTCCRDRWRRANLSRDSHGSLPFNERIKENPCFA